MRKKILAIGFKSIHNEDVKCFRLKSKQSLMDGDITLFRPRIDDFIDSSSIEKDGPYLSIGMGLILKDHIKHWRREIKEATANGKLVIVYLTELKCVFAIREKNTGLSILSTFTSLSSDYVEYKNYDFIPGNLELVNSGGSVIKLSAGNSGIITSYWREFSEHSKYRVTIKGDLSPYLVTKGEEKNGRRSYQR